MTNMILTTADFLSAPLVMLLLIAPLVGMTFNTDEETDND